MSSRTTPTTAPHNRHWPFKSSLSSRSMPIS
jgi:hypothetical protein